MAGTWVIMEVKSIGTVNMNGKEAKIQATVEVEGEILRITTVNPTTDKR